MRAMKVAVLLGVLGLALPASAAAQATRTWVSGVGDDVNPCSRTAPCKTWAGAISKTAAGGEIDALDPGGFGAVTIMKGITLDGAGHVSSILASGTTGITINIPQSVSQRRVTLRNMSINGAGSFLGLRGVSVVGEGAQHIRLERMRIFNFTDCGVCLLQGGGTDATVRMTIEDSQISDVLGDGIRAAPTTTQSNSVNNRLTVFNTAIAGNNGSGIEVNGSQRRTIANVIESRIVDNVGEGVLADGVNANIRLSGNALFGNGHGLKTLNSGKIGSWGDNRILSNIIDGIPTANYTRK